MAWGNNYGNNYGNRQGSWNGNRQGSWDGNRQSSRFTKAQQRAYDSGRGYRLGQAGKAIVFNNPQNKESFRAGYKSVDVNRYRDTKPRQ